MEVFEQLLETCRRDVERYVFFTLNKRQEAEDVCQDVFLAAYEKFDALHNRKAFKGWLLAIARNKCRDFVRRKMHSLEIAMDVLPERGSTYGRMGMGYSPAEEAMDMLPDMERNILQMFYGQHLSQKDIAWQLGIPVGTVKSRLHHARHAFEQAYRPKGDDSMTQMPMNMPTYTIKRLPEPPFSVRWEELMGWQIVPKLGEKITWALYDAPSGKRTEYTEMAVTGRAVIHGIEGVEIRAVQYSAEDYYRTGCVDRMERTFVAQLTDTHTRYLSESHVENDVRMNYTFLDGDVFINNWGFGEDNCGNEVNIAPKGLLKREGNVITHRCDREVLDIAGRYRVTIRGNVYDTVCVMDVNCFNDAVCSEQYLDEKGRTVLWRRFNRDDWAFARYGKKWTEMLPDNERLVINGETYVHWYDCISDYVL